MTEISILEEIKSEQEAREQKKLDYQKYIWGMTGDDLPKLQERIRELEKQKSDILAEISSTEKKIEKSNQELSVLKWETNTTNVDKKVKKILELEKAIVLLDSKLITLRGLLPPIDAEIPKIYKDISALRNHLIMVRNTETITPVVERFRAKEAELRKIQVEVEELWQEVVTASEEYKPHYYIQSNGYNGIFKNTANSVHTIGYTTMKQYPYKV